MFIKHSVSNVIVQYFEEDGEGEVCGAKGGGSAQLTITSGLKMVYFIVICSEMIPGHNIQGVFSERSLLSSAPLS